MASTSAAMIVLIAFLALAGCSSGKSSSTTAPDSSASTSPTNSASATTPAWHATATPLQISAFNAALQRWEQAESELVPIYAAPKLKPADRKIFAKYYPKPFDFDAWDFVRRSKEQGIFRLGSPEIYWSKPTGISELGSAVTITQCVSSAPITFLIDGKEQPSPYSAPHSRVVKMYKAPGYNWLIEDVIEPTRPAELKSCDPETKG